MDHAIHVRPMAVDVQMAGCVRREFQFSLDDLTFHVNDDHVFWAQVFIAHSRWLDSDIVGLGVARTDVAARPGHQPILGQLEVQLPNLFT